MFGVRCGGMGLMWCAVWNDVDEKYEDSQDAANADGIADDEADAGGGGGGGGDGGGGVVVMVVVVGRGCCTL